MSKTVISLPERFDSCSVAEIGSCILYRRDTIREIRKFLKDPNSRQYPTIRAKVRLSILIDKDEIHWLNQARHLLLATGCKNIRDYRWNQEGDNNGE